jgi:hypothetical protein
MDLKKANCFSGVTSSGNRTVDRGPQGGVQILDWSQPKEEKKCDPVIYVSSVIFLDMV